MSSKSDIIKNRRKKRVDSIITQLEQNENLSSTDKKWINSCTLKFKNNPTSFSNEALQILDLLSPHLGYSWRVGLQYRDPSKFDKSLKEILNRLKNNQSLLSGHKTWINGYRQQYLKNSEKFSKERRQQLDELNTYLGFDWKLLGGFENEVLIKNTATLKSLLLAKKSIPKGLENWLRNKTKSYENYPKKFNEFHIKLLDELNPLLGYDWKVYKNKKKEASRASLKIIKRDLKAGKKLSHKSKTWIYGQRALYISHPNTFSKETKDSLDALIPLLGFDWKIPKGVKSTLSLSERVDFIKKDLGQGNQMNPTNKFWLEKIRRKYTKGTKSFKKHEIEKLNELNDLLDVPWQKTSLEVIREQKTFDYYIKEIKKAGLEYNDLPDRFRDWILIQRKLFKANENNFNAEEKQKLDSIIPVIGRDWAVDYVTPYDVENFNFRYSEIKEKLVIGEKLSAVEVKYLSLKRLQFSQGKLTDEYIIKKMDSLIPLLGYDWKEWRKKIRKHKPFNQHLIDIEERLKAHKRLNKTQLEILRMKRIEYNENPTSFPIEEFNGLESLIPLLERDWKEKIKHFESVYPFEQRVKLLEAKLTSYEDLNQPDKDFLRKQRYQYRKDKKMYDKKRIILLDKLIDILGYDWKLYVDERE